MTTAMRMMERFQRVNLTELMGEVIEEDPEMVTSLTKNQLKRGLNKKGEKLQKYKSDRYAKKKNQMNQLPGLGNPDLIYTGDFISSIVVDVRGDDVVFGAGDRKAPALEAKYGSAIFGLTDESKKELRPELIQGSAKKIKQITGAI